MELLEAIRTRRSVRQYKDEAIPEETLGRLLDAARWTPSWANTQCWEIIVVKEAAMKAQLRETLGKNPAFDAMGQVPVVLALCAGLGKAGYKQGERSTRFGDWFMYDLGLLTQNICLAAHDAGLGTVIVGRLDHARAEALLGVPQGYSLVSLIPVGWPAAGPTPPRRREIADFVHPEKF
jgi:nitroreductase